MTNFTKEDLDKMLSPEVKDLNAEALGLDSDRLSGQGGSLIPPRTKYNARRVFFNGRWYPSYHQAEDAAKFHALWKAGKVRGVIEEVAFALPGKTDKDKAFVHRVDFGVIELNGVVTWYESKGRDLALGKLKRRQVEELYHIKINLI